MSNKTIEQKAIKLISKYSPWLKENLLIEEHLYEFDDVAGLIELAIAEEHAACVNAPARTLMQMANMLPHGWTMQIDLQKGAGGVSLFGPFDDLYEPDTGNGIEADMAQAVQFANFRNSEQETAVNGAWSRFVAAMGNDMPDSPKDEVSE